MIRRLIPLLLLALAAVGTVRPVEVEAQTIPASIHLNQDIPVNGKFDSRYLTRSAGTQIIWSAIPAQSRTSGSSYTVNMRSLYLIEPGGSTIGITGCSLPTGWSTTTDGLAYSGTGTGSALCQMTATLGGVVYPSNVFQVAATTGDTLAPSIPIQLTATSGPGSITWQWKPSTDQHDGTSVGSGLKNYDLFLNGGTTAVVTDSGAGVTTAGTLNNIGSISSPSTPTAVQSGGQWTITAGGTGIDTAPDQFAFKAWAITGDFQLSITVSSITSNGSQYAPQGLMWRVSTDASERYVSLYQWATASTQGVQSKWRPTAAGAKVTGTFAAGSNTARSLLLTRTGCNTTSDTWSFYQSTDATTFTPLGSPLVLQLPCTGIAGFFGTSMQAGVANVAVFNNFSLSQRADLQYVQTTSAAATAQVRARDLAASPNLSAYSAVIAGSPNSVSGAAVKWHPGIYVLGASVIQPGSTGYSTTEINELGTMPNVVGREQLITWSALETSRGVYDFTALDALFAAVKAQGKRLVIQVLDRSFSGTSAGRLPAYLATEPNGGGGWYVKPNGGVIAKLWLPAIRAREIALYQAIAAHVISGGTLTYDTDPKFEGVFTCESDTGFTTGPSDYGSTGPQDWLDALRAIGAAVVAVFPHTNVWASTNFIPTGQVSVANLIGYYADRRIGFTTPDTVVNGGDADWGTKVVHGLIYSGGVWTSSGGHDYRTDMNVAHDLEDPEMGGKEGGFSASTLYSTWSYTYNGDMHWFVSRKTNVYGTNQQLMWDNSSYTGTLPAAGSYTPDLKTFINAGGHPTHTTCPASYTLHAGGCNTGGSTMTPDLFVPDQILRPGITQDAANDDRYGEEIHRKAA